MLLVLFQDLCRLYFLFIIIIIIDSDVVSEAEELQMLHFVQSAVVALVIHYFYAEIILKIYIKCIGERGVR